MEQTTIDTSKLITVFNYAKRKKLTTAAIYKQIKKNKLKAVEIDGMKFIQI